MNEAMQDFYDKIQKGIIEANSKQTEEIKQQIKTEIQTIREVVKEESKKTANLQKNFEELKNKCDNLQKSFRKNNIIVFGMVDANEESLASYTVNRLNQLLQINLTTSDINDIFRIGKAKENRPIIVKFISYLKKVEVLRNCKKLKDTGVYINEDLSLEEREEKRILRKHLKQAQSQKLQAYIKGNKLHVHDQIYTVQQLLEGDEETPIEETEERNDSEIQQTEREQQRKRTNSAAVTPNRNTETEDHEEKEAEESDNIKKKRKITAPIYTLGRSSARLQNKEVK